MFQFLLERSEMNGAARQLFRQKRRIADEKNEGMVNMICSIKYDWF